MPNNIININTPIDPHFRMFMDIVEILDTLSHPALQDIARRARVHITTLYGWRAYAVSTPHLATFTRVAKVLGYTVTLVDSRGVEMGAVG